MTCTFRTPNIAIVRNCTILITVFNCIIVFLKYSNYYNQVKSTTYVIQVIVLIEKGIFLIFVNA